MMKKWNNRKVEVQIRTVKNWNYGKVKIWMNTMKKRNHGKVFCKDLELWKSQSAAEDDKEME